MTEQLQDLAASLVARGKGILAADETVPTLTRRFDALRIASTEQTRRDYREMLFTFPGACGVHQRRHPAGRDDPPERRGRGAAGRSPFAARDHARHQGRYRRPAAGGMPRGNRDGRARRACATGSPNTAASGARFAKWRAVIRIGDGLPSAACISANAHALARYAALCQEQGLVPIVEPEVLMDGRTRHRTLRAGDRRRPARRLQCAVRISASCSRACC